ncbi:CBS domain-containing protein [Gimesia algae]|uniref:CBS domain protein n=1 Tax=Gimesia algae TaxID=2527971 RepID=A0A517VG21_9PLAN|nr:CBS domain-containing protein [Gimesia algae]QDT91973.1 CBS domain protein [Gimesia algae]
MRVRVRDLMTVNPVSVCLGTTLQTAAEQMVQAEASEIYVIDQQRRLVGVVPEYDLLKYRLTHYHLEAPIDSLMYVQIESLSPEDDALQLAPLFRDRRNSCMAVTEQGLLVGKLSCRDLFRVMLTLDAIEDPEQTAEQDTSEKEVIHSASSTINPPHLPPYSTPVNRLQLNSSSDK